MPPLVAHRCALSIDLKRKILECIDEKLMPKTEIAKKFGIPKSTLFTIVKNRESILKAAPERMRLRDGIFPLLEKALLDWMKGMRSKNIALDENALKEKATVFLKKLCPNESFKASDGWLQNFKHRHEIVFKKNMRGELFSKQRYRAYIQGRNFKKNYGKL
ncbi:tigger transposable element-derived protein 4-like [Parasteatoda tepidariorum]|uniref:tigger transposable element-derived protein 4-like n=1 Tax=Parasteatoda tepidariorum TaxID=114398 RepID=UPI0039BD8E48